MSALNRVVLAGATVLVGLAILGLIFAQSWQAAVVALVVLGVAVAAVWAGRRRLRRDP